LSGINHVTEEDTISLATDTISITTAI
jgi:hypothetical protein